MTITVDVLHERGRAALLGAGPVLDSPPAEGGRRWGLSVLARPQPDLAARLHEITTGLVEVAGPGHWSTGASGTSHLTLYSLEPHRVGVTAADPAARRYADAMRRTARASGPASFTVTGLALTPGGIVASCTPRDDAARALRPRLVEALGGDVFEGSYRSDQWWISLLHLAAPLRDPAALVEHVESRRSSPVGVLVADRLELVRYDYRSVASGTGMVPVPLATAPLTGGRTEVPGGARA